MDKEFKNMLEDYLLGYKDAICMIIDLLNIDEKNCNCENCENDKSVMKEMLEDKDLDKVEIKFKYKNEEKGE